MKATQFLGRLFLTEEVTKKEICTSLHHPHRKKRQRANLRCGTSMHKTAKAKLFVMQRTVFIIHNMMNQSSTKIIAAAPILALLVQFAPMSLRAGADAPDGELRLDRYTLQPQNPTAEQLDLLATVVETQFPESIATVGAAIDYLLERSGYRRIPNESTAAGNVAATSESASAYRPAETARRPSDNRRSSSKAARKCGNQSCMVCENHQLGDTQG